MLRQGLLRLHNLLQELAVTEGLLPEPEGVHVLLRRDCRGRGAKHARAGADGQSRENATSPHRLRASFKSVPPRDDRGILTAAPLSMSARAPSNLLPELIVERYTRCLGKHVRRFWNFPFGNVSHFSSSRGQTGVGEWSLTPRWRAREERESGGTGTSTPHKARAKWRLLPRLRTLSRISRRRRESRPPRPKR